MDKRTARRLATLGLSAAARRLRAEARTLGLADEDRARVEDAFDALAAELDRRGGGTPPQPGPIPGQLPLFDTTREDDGHAEAEDHV